MLSGNNSAPCYRDNAADKHSKPEQVTTTALASAASPLLSWTEKLAFPAASGGILKKKRCPPSGSSGSVAPMV